MKKILMITNHSFMFWQFRRELVMAMLEQGHRVTIALPFGERMEELRGMGCDLINTDLERRGTNPFREVDLIRQYRRILKQEKPDVVVTYSVKPNVYAGILCGQLGIPCCINVQGIGTAFQRKGLATLVTALYRAAAKNARVVFFENEDNAKLFREKGIIPQEKQKVLSGAGVNLAHYTRTPYPSNDRVRFLYLGRLMQEKGVEELFAAARRLHRDGESFFLDLVGFFEEGYKEQVDQLTSLGICRFHGFQLDPRPWYGGADCVVLASYHEGMSNVLLEAAAIGRPLISSDIPGCREAVEDGVSGFLCRPKDEASLYEAMKRVLAMTREEREAMGLAGHEKMRAEFDKQRVVEETLAGIFKED